MAAASTAAAGSAAFKLVVLLSVAHFQVALPSRPGLVSPSFDDSPAGVTAFVDWLQPHLAAPEWNAPPRKVCVVAAESFEAGHSPYLPKPLYESQPPLHSLEPYSATFHYIEAAQRKAGIKHRTMAQALSLCRSDR